MIFVCKIDVIFAAISHKDVPDEHFLRVTGKLPVKVGMLHSTHVHVL